MVEKNRIIAEFMGISVINRREYTEYLRENHQNGIYYSAKSVLDESLDYDNDWNSLVYVISKCFVGEAELSPEESKKYITPIYTGLCNLDIVETHSAVVEFIKWYNENKN